MAATNHQTELQAILDAAVSTAKANPTAANISAVEKARKALDEYLSAQAGDPAGEKFKTQAAALQYLQRTWKIEKSKLSKDVQDGKVPRKDGTFSARDLDYYANACRLEPKNSEHQPVLSDNSERLKKAMAEEREYKLRQLKGALLDAAEEERRDALLLLGIRRHLEMSVPDWISAMVSGIAKNLTDDQRAQLAIRNPEIAELMNESIAESFDMLARQGGVEVELVD